MSGRAARRAGRGAWPATSSAGREAPEIVGRRRRPPRRREPRDRAAAWPRARAGPRAGRAAAGAGPRPRAAPPSVEIGRPRPPRGPAPAPPADEAEDQRVVAGRAAGVDGARRAADERRRRGSAAATRRVCRPICRLASRSSRDRLHRVERAVERRAAPPRSSRPARAGAPATATASPGPAAPLQEHAPGTPRSAARSRTRAVLDVGLEARRSARSRRPGRGRRRTAAAPSERRQCHAAPCAACRWPGRRGRSRVALRRRTPRRVEQLRPWRCRRARAAARRRAASVKCRLPDLERHARAPRRGRAGGRRAPARAAASTSRYQSGADVEHGARLRARCPWAAPAPPRGRLPC